MHVTSRHSLVAAGLVSLGLLAPIATTATAAPAKPAPKAPRYVADVMGPRAQPQPYSFGTAALDVSNPGEVLVRAGYDQYVLASGVKVRTLASTEAISEYSVVPDVMTPNGVVYGGGLQVLAKWTRRGVEGRTVFGGESAHGRYGVGAANARGDVAGCSWYVKVGYPFVGSFSKNTISQLTWPDNTNGNCSVTGMSDRGVTTLNQEAPNYRHEEVYPRPATMTTAGVRFLKVAKGQAGSADAISPNGRLIAGRVFTDGNPTPVWLSHRRGPVALKGAGAMTPKVVTDKAVVFGEEKGRVVMWQAGRKTDLTKVSNLPRGWVLTSVSDINARGQLAVTATIAARNETVAMRLTPRR